MPLGLGGFDKSLDFQHRDPNLQMAAFTPRLVRKVMDSLELRMHNPDMRDLSGTGLCTSPSLGAMCWSLSRGIRKKRGKKEGEKSIAVFHWVFRVHGARMERNGGNGGAKAD